MRFMTLLSAACLLGASPAAAGFASDKADIVALVLERVRVAPDDAGRALKAGEIRLRRLHDDFRLAKSTPPTSLDGDVRAMTSAAHKIRLERSRGRTPAADPRAGELVERGWEDYRLKVQALLEDVRYKRESGASESAVYWQALKDHRALEENLFESLAYNAPPGERTVEEAAGRDRWTLMKQLEDPARVRGLPGCVAVPEEHALTHAFDVGAFYRAAGALPGSAPLRKGAYRVPAGCRTVTHREAGVKTILRAAKGRGSVRIGTEDKALAYDYVMVPPEAPYIVINSQREPLDVEYVGILP